jgi:hypothetical protein
VKFLEQTSKGLVHPQVDKRHMHTHTHTEREREREREERLTEGILQYVSHLCTDRQKIIILKQIKAFCAKTAAKIKVSVHMESTTMGV